MKSFASFRSNLGVPFQLSNLRLFPKSLRGWQRVDADLLPPDALVSATMKLAVMIPAQWNSVFIAHLSSHSSGLGELEMMRIGRLPAAGQAGLGGNKFQVLAIAPAQRFA
jgi:hypothetical protein